MLQLRTLKAALFWAALCAFLLPASAGAFVPRGVAAAGTGADHVLTTEYWSILYPQGEDASAKWYAGFADDVDKAVSDMLGSPPVTGLKLHIYNSEAEYEAANPLAAQEPGIMAHAIPEERAVGVAVERLRQADPDTARQSFRHEMTHIVAGVLSDNKLPVGFQEGLAQYNELSAARGQSVAEAVRDAQGKNVPLLSWDALNTQPTFANNINVAYPESYTVMDFLAQNYGMADYAAFLGSLRDGAALDAALMQAYGKPVSQLESEWRAYLPGFLNGGWKTDLFTYYDLAPAQALYDAGQYKEAQAYYEQSEKLYRQLGKSDQADKIEALKQQVIQAQGTNDLARSARQALQAHDYAKAAQLSAQARNVSDPQASNTTEAIASGDNTAQLAAQGVSAVDLLNRAEGQMQSWNLLSAGSEAQQAAQTFASLGDTARLDSANALLSDIWLWRRAGGIAALCMGILALAVGTLVYLRARKRRARGVPAHNEEKAAWL